MPGLTRTCNRLRDARLISRITRLSAERLALRPGLEVFAIIKAVSVNHRAAGGGVTV
jgi:molybdopterin-binding protein